MPHGNAIRHHDTIGVAVVSYKTPRLHTRADVLANAHKIRQMIEGMKLGLPDLALVVFPRHSTQGMPLDQAEAAELACTIPGPEMQVLAQACRNAKVWGAFPIAVDHPPCTALVLMNEQGEVVQQHRDNPAGMKVSLLIGNDANAKLSVRCHGQQTLVDFNGRALGECGEDDYGIQYAPLSAPGHLTIWTDDLRSRPTSRRPDAPAHPARP